ncbi:FAD-dependent monooxygenase [Granulicoccus phenolivorans]|uniref:FAD-dependent monooxygenase n=2 Tax=Granulicoccus phenolivorans TaxID=266854 RepID=UPI000685AB8C|nr:FAD-dependent monooxygenase [Granulicoccus phenolivorans]
MAARGLPSTPGRRLTAIEQSPLGVTARFSDGTEATGDVLIGCDGVGSFTRRWIDPDAPEPRFTGLLSIGGFARLPGLAPTPGVQRMIFGARGFFGYLVRTDGTVYWFANPNWSGVDPDRVRRMPTDQWLTELRELHAQDPFPVPQILAAADEVGAYPIYDLPHVPHWHRGRVVAVGDAVHATSPNAGQGASLALEDAVTLARCLRDRPSHPPAFDEYVRLRRPRAEEVVKYSRALGRRKAPGGSRLAVGLRDLMLPLVLRNATRDARNNHLYNHPVNWDGALSGA